MKLWGVVVLLVLQLPSYANSEAVFLKESVVVSTSVIKLGDVIDAVLPNKISDVILSNSPRSNKRLIVKREYISKIFSDHGFNEYSIQGSEQVIIRTLSQMIDKNTIVDFVSKYIKSSFEGEEGDLKVSIDLKKGIKVPIGNVEFFIKKMSPKKLKDNNYVWLGISVDDQYYQTLKLTARSEYYQLWPFTRHNISKFEHIGEGDIRYKLVNILKYSSTDLNVESGYWQASKNYKENEAILMSGVEKRPLVESGDLFQGVLKSGPVTINLKLKALERGFVNNTIKAERSNSNKVLNVRLQLDKFKRIFGVIE